VWREQRGHNDWELTSHVGAHLTDVGAARALEATEATVAAAVATRGSREDVPA